MNSAFHRILGVAALCLGGNAAGAVPLRVVTLFPILTEIARDVGGPDVAVTSLLPPGVDPHTFEPAPRDMRALADADLVLASGLGLENYLDKLAVNSGTRAKIVAVGDVLRDRALVVESHGRREFDPHWWNSIMATQDVVRRIADQLAELRPENAADIRGRASELLARLGALDAWTKEQLSVLPPGKRQLVTSHDAFGWFSRDYGFTVHPIAGLSPGAEPDAHELAQLVELLRREKIPAVFIEDSESSKLASALAREAGARIGGTLYPDGLVPEADGSTYEALFRHNVLTIVQALR